jgi:heptose-I-phosphate ethanolaminephosphotransferase
MTDGKRAAFGPRAFAYSLAGLGALPLLPEVGLFLQNHTDIKAFVPIIYYQFAVSFLVLMPALLLPRLLARIWVVMVGLPLAVSTIIVGFYSASIGAHWNLTAHTALMQTNAGEAWGFLQSFSSVGRIAWVAFLGVAFLACIGINVLSAPPPRWRSRLGAAAVGLLVCAHGIRSAVVYGGVLIHNTPVSGSHSLRVVEVGINSLHPLTLLAATHYNYLATHQYYLQQFDQSNGRFDQLKGAKTLPGCVSPRVVVVVIGESANRLHWSLYGYPRPTTPQLQGLSRELFVFTDVISSCAATLCSIQGMLATTGESLPTFNMFSGAGYSTHWLSAQYNQGTNDIEMVGLVGSCGERVFLSAAYDGNLVPLMAQAAGKPGRQMIFLNLFGSHVRYSDRYPESEALFHGASVAEKLRATYDNSIHYTDRVIAELIETLRSRHESSCLLYVSDHGEDVYDSRPDKYLFRDESIATDPMYEVPFFVWFSPEYIRDNREFVEHDVAAAVGRKYQNRALYNALLDLARLEHPLYDARMDLFSPQFVERERRVGVAGRLYIKTD